VGVEGTCIVGGPDEKSVVRFAVSIAHRELTGEIEGLGEVETCVESSASLEPRSRFRPFSRRPSARHRCR
jgi:hypothetical protein